MARLPGAKPGYAVGTPVISATASAIISAPMRRRYDREKFRVSA